MFTPGSGVRDQSNTDLWKVPRLHEFAWVEMLDNAGNWEFLDLRGVEYTMVNF